MNKYTIFLASSAELSEERKEFKAFISDKNKEWNRDGISLELRIWEDTLAALSAEGSQEEYNKIIREQCDIFVMLFFTKVGKYSKEEFEVALENFKAIGKPWMFVYFKDAAMTTGKIDRKDMNSVWAFQDRLEELKHFQSTYQNTDALLRNFNFQLEELLSIGFFKAGKTAGNGASRRSEFPKELTLSIPKTDPATVVGREADLEQLRALLNAERKVIVVNGLGGIGKTTLAQAYLGKYFDEYEHVAWIAQSSDNIENDFVNAAGLVENLGIDAGGATAEQIFKEIIRRLKNIDTRPNLLVIDNAEQSLQHYRDLLPGQPVWHVLITSREEIEGFYIHELAFLNEQQAIALFRKHYKRNIEDEQIIEFLRAVDFHTLTIEILAKTAQVQRYEISTLKNAIENDLRAKTQVPHSRLNTIENIGSYLRSVFNMSLLNADEIWVMKQFVCLPPEFHSYELLRELVLGEKSNAAATFSEILTKLAQRGWLLYNKDSDTYKMHRIIAGVIRSEYPTTSDDVSKLVNSVSMKLRGDVVIQSYIGKFKWIPFGKAILSYFGDEMFEEIGSLQNNLALTISDLGDYQEAKVIMESAVKVAEKFNGPESSITMLRYGNLATALTDLGEYAGAKVLLEKQVKSDEKVYGEDNPQTTVSRSNLAMVLRSLGEFREAKSLLENVVKADEKNFGTDHTSTARSYSNLGLVLRDMGDNVSARPLLEKALKVYEQQYGLDHPLTAITYTNLAMLLLDIGEAQESKTLLESARDSDLKNFGVNHPAVARDYSNLALVFSQLGNYAEALELCEKSLAIFKRLLPENHPYIQRVTRNYQSILKSSNDNHLK